MYPPNRTGPSAGHVATQRVTSPENSPEAIAATMTNTLKGVPTSSVNCGPKSSGLSCLPSLTGIQGMPETTSEKVQSPQETSQDATTSLPTVNAHSTPDSPQQDKLPDLVTVDTGKSTGNVDATAKTTKNTNPVESFNVDLLSTEDELDAVDALLSLSGIRDDSVDPTTENEQIMPIGGSNLPVDVAPVPIELGQVQVDHEIAKITSQEEEQATAEQLTGDNAENPTTSVTTNEDPNTDISPS